MDNERHDPGENSGDDRHADRAGEPFDGFIVRGDVRLQVLRAGDGPRGRTADPPAVHQQAVYQIHNRQNDERLSEALQKAARAVHGVHEDEHTGDVNGQADDLE